MEIFEINKKYKIVLSINNHTLTFTGKVIFENNDFFKFIDKFGEERGYTKKVLISWEEMK